MSDPENQPELDPLLEQILRRITELNRQLPPADTQPASGPAPAPQSSIGPLLPDPAEDIGAPDKPVGEWLEEMGLLPVYLQHVLSQLELGRDNDRASSPAEDLRRVQTCLRNWWRPVPANEPPPSVGAHLFVGPCGAGKTVVLSKWLAQAVLLGERSAYIWRLDGQTANTAEALSIYGEVLGVPVARAWTGERQPVDLELFDLPGSDWRDASAMAALAGQIKAFGSPRVHLVLNAAYDVRVLFDQVRAFSACPVADLILTHLDEEVRWGKLWNLVAGTHLPIRFLSAGQNVPGHFREATPDLLMHGPVPKHEA